MKTFILSYESGNFFWFKMKKKWGSVTEYKDPNVKEPNKKKSICIGVVYVAEGIVVNV